MPQRRAEPVWLPRQLCGRLYPGAPATGHTAASAVGDGLPGTPLACLGLLLLSLLQEWQEKKRAPFYKTYPKA